MLEHIATFLEGKTAEEFLALHATSSTRKLREGSSAVLAFFKEREEMRARIRGAFSTSYLTLLSIIQGTAFAALFAKVQSLVTQYSFHAPEFVMAVGILLLIVALWHQYLIGTMLYNWALQLTDSLLPFAFGVLEFAMIIRTGKQRRSSCCQRTLLPHRCRCL